MARAGTPFPRKGLPEDLFPGVLVLQRSALLWGHACRLSCLATWQPKGEGKTLLEAVRRRSRAGWPAIAYLAPSTVVVLAVFWEGRPQSAREFTTGSVLLVACAAWLILLCILARPRLTRMARGRQFRTMAHFLTAALASSSVLFGVTFYIVASSSSSDGGSLLGVATFLLGGLLATFAAAIGLVTVWRARRKPSCAEETAILLEGRDLSIATLCVFGIVVAATIPTLGSRVEPPECGHQLRHLRDAIWDYCSVNNDRLPPASTWFEAVLGLFDPDQRRRRSRWMAMCPATTANDEYSYAFNVHLSEVDLGRVPLEVCSNVVLLFEVEGGHPRYGDQDDVMPEPVHEEGYMILFLDGNIRSVRRSDLDC